MFVKTINDIEKLCSDHPSHLWCDRKERCVEGRRKVLCEELAVKVSRSAIERIMVLFDGCLEISRRAGRYMHREETQRPDEPQQLVTRST